MSNCSCKNCYYYDICHSNQMCDDYAPATEEAEDLLFAQIVEQERTEFNAAWSTYINQYN